MNTSFGNLINVMEFLLHFSLKYANRGAQLIPVNFVTAS